MTCFIMLRANLGFHNDLQSTNLVGQRPSETPRRARFAIFTHRINKYNFHGAASGHHRRFSHELDFY